MSRLARTNPKRFWKEIKKENKSKAFISDKLNTGDLFNHFSEMYEMNDIQNPSGVDNDEHTNIINDLDSEITQEEILKVIQSLKASRSPGLDALISEIFKSCTDIGENL